MENCNFDKREIDVLGTISRYVDINAFPAGKSKQFDFDIKEDRSCNMNIYQVSVLDKGGNNNCIGKYIVLMNTGDKIDFLEYREHKDQELYIVINGCGEYIEFSPDNSLLRKSIIEKGNITSNQSNSSSHTIINTGDEPLIIFMVINSTVMV